MVEYTEFMSVALNKCGPTGGGTQAERRETFEAFAQLWTDEKELIKEMNRSELREQIECP